MHPVIAMWKLLSWASSLLTAFSIRANCLKNVFDRSCDRGSLQGSARIDRLEIEHQYQLAFLTTFGKSFWRNRFRSNVKSQLGIQLLSLAQALPAGYESILPPFLKQRGIRSEHRSSKLFAIRH